MTNEYREQLDALIAAGEGFADDRIVVLSDGMESMYPDGRLFVEGAPAAVEYCAQAANARPALKALVARLELAEAVCESCRWEKSGWSGSDEMMYDEKALEAWRAAKEAEDA